jgi:hypothetical protein
MSGNDNANPVQLAGLAESAADTLYRLVSTVPLPGEDPAIPHSLAAAVVVRKLEPALDHIARTLSSPAVRDALPHAARHLDVAVAGIGTAARVIRSAEPAIRAGKAPAAAEGAQGRGEAAPAGRAGGPDFTGAPSARQDTSSRRRAASTGSAPSARQVRPGRPR